jgi:hypothetical protein
MIYLLAIVAPPVALCLVGKPVLAVLAFLLCVTWIGWIPASIWAALVVNDVHAERRHRETLRATRQQ